MSRTSWASEFDAKRQAWSEIDKLKKELKVAQARISELEQVQSLAEHDKQLITAFVLNVNETGQFGWSDCQWLTDYVEEYFEQLKDY